LLSLKLTKGGLSTEVQKSIPIVYDELVFEEGYRADPVHAKQVLTYIRLANLRLGYLLNFGEARLKTGIKRLING